MPLPSDTLYEIETRIKAVRERIASLDEIITDLRASGIDASKREEEVRTLKEEAHKWEIFYALQKKRSS